MKKLVLLVCTFSLFAAASLLAQGRDTVQAFRYEDLPKGKVLMPPLSESFEKIYMHYKLRCPFDGPCGEWDYLMYIYLYDHTGVMDSVIDTSYSFMVNGLTPNSLSFMWMPSWWYFPSYQYNVTRLTTTSLDTATIGSTVYSQNIPFDGKSELSHSQFLYKKAELSATGLKPGDITGIRFYVDTAGTEIQNLCIRLRSSKKDSISAWKLETDSFVTVYRKNTTFTPGVNSFQFFLPFTWDGNSNIVVDVSFDGNTPGKYTKIFSNDPVTFNPSFTTSTPAKCLRFEGKDFIEVPPEVFADIDSEITIAFWQYGDPAKQPQNQSSFEGIDAHGQRVLNAHVPWSDTVVYWDAGTRYQKYDRISKKALSNDIRGKWTHWTFTKNVKAGTMKIYLNGVLWLSGTAKKKPMSGITRFRIGSGAGGDNNFAGLIDEFAIWRRELTASEVASVIGTNLETSSSLRPPLLYNFEENYEDVVLDRGGSNHNGSLVGRPQHIIIPAKDLYQNARYNTFIGYILPRPNITFEQGKYTTKIDTVVKVDSLMKDVTMVIRYQHTLNGPKVIDTMYVYPTYANKYKFDTKGNVTDSSIVPADSTLNQSKQAYERKFEIVNRYEIGRYITPYGNSLSLGEGFTWTYDVSDYSTLLHDSVDIEAFNQQELVDLSFEFVKGTPPRNVTGIRNLWNGDFWYGTARSIEEDLKPITLKIPDNSFGSLLKMRPTGHGGGDQENCAEFCPKDHWLMVNDTERFRKTVWRDDCGLNPVYPQGGTWVYSRTNWCPGADVETYDIELTPWVKPGDSVKLDYNVEPYTTNGAGNTPNFVTETQLVSYGKPNFTLDARIDEIESPSSTDIFRRHNPICSGPVIVIENTGSTDLSSLDISYGVDDMPPQSYHWTSSKKGLSFLQKEEVTLPGILNYASSSKTFHVTISNPNGGTDEYANNNSAESDFSTPPSYPNTLVFEYKTNSSPEEDSYEITNANGNVVWHRDNTLDPNTYYRDTLSLPDGCYLFHFTDDGNDGLSWWANTTQGSGTMKIKRASGTQVLKTFGTDFGKEIWHQFSIGSTSSVAESDASQTELSIYPNPAPKKFTAKVEVPYPQDVQIMVYDLLGNEVWSDWRKQMQKEEITVDLSLVPAGTYIVRVTSTETGTMSKKVIIH